MVCFQVQSQGHLRVGYIAGVGIEISFFSDRAKFLNIMNCLMIREFFHILKKIFYGCVVTKLRAVYYLSYQIQHLQAVATNMAHTDNHKKIGTNEDCLILCWFICR